MSTTIGTKITTSGSGPPSGVRKSPVTTQTKNHIMTLFFEENSGSTTRSLISA